MKDDIAIKVDGVYKDFKLPHERTNSLKSAVMSIGKKKRKGYEVQHALKNISFEVKKGEFFGIVGRNGSGKSTLLKIIAEIYRPTKGKVTKSGRLVPFIELGVGFNPELTGRENVYLNGALLGFSKKEVEAMYDDIVAFAELEKFMDQKLKNYSSGMQVRLAFSVATRANADILVLDEVLAVGDESFQRKCDAYFKKVKEDKTTTVILVTHNMDAVRKFCDSALLIQDSVIKTIGKNEDVANQYIMENLSSPKQNERLSDGEYADGLSERVPRLKVTTDGKQLLNSNDNLKFKINYEIMDDTPINVKMSILDEGRGGYPIIQNGTSAITKKGKNSFEYEVPLSLYNNTNLYIVATIDEVITKKRIAYTNEENSLRVAVQNTDKFSATALLRREGKYYGKWNNGTSEF